MIKSGLQVPNCSSLPPSTMAMRRLWRSSSLRHLRPTTPLPAPCVAASERARRRSPPHESCPRTRSTVGLPLPASSLRQRLVLSSFPLPEELCARIGVRSLSNQAWVDVPAGEVVDVPLAQTGEGIAECELLKWFVKEGDHVEEFQLLCEVQSDKATIEITSRFKGRVLQMLYAPGAIVKVGETLLKILVGDADGHGINIPVNSGSCKPESQASSTEAEVACGVLSTPAVRNLAKQYGLDLNDIRGTGKDGRVLKEDVLRFAASKGVDNEQLLSIPPDTNKINDEFEPFKERKAFDTNMIDTFYEDKSIPLRGYHRAMVRSMTLAAKIPHFHYLEEINFDALAELKATFQNENKDQNVKHTFLPFLIKSLSMALSKHPILNSSFNEEANEVVLKGCHNIGVAMATPYGLVVPNIKRVQSLSLLEITKELARLHLLASNNKLSSEDIAGGTITLSNIGAIGGKFGSPLVNSPEVAIVALGRIQRLPRFDDDENVYPAAVGNVNIGADHRIVDGATVARFCNDWKHLVEKPELLLLHMR